MKTQKAEEIFDKHNIMTMAFNKQKVLNAMHDHTTPQIEALRERLKQPIELQNGVVSFLDENSIDKVFNEFLKEINDEK